MLPTNRSRALLAVAAVLSLSRCSFAARPSESPPAAIRGITRDPGGLLPQAATEVIVHNVTQGTDRHEFSGPDGLFLIANLPPGRYSLQAQKIGFAKSALTALELSGGEVCSTVLVLGAATAANSAEQDAKPATPPAAQPQAPGSFFHRFFKAYHDDWLGGPSDDPPAARRAGTWPAPVSGPPFPFADWPIGGTVEIAARWTQSGPLMQAIWSGPHGDFWKRRGIQIYGWLNAGGNWSTSHDTNYPTYPNGKYNNYPASYDEVGNAIEPNQMVLYIEREPNTVQTDHFDWGFRASGLWGLDYRFTTAKGWLSQQLLGSQPNGQQPIGCAKPTGLCKEYGFDPVMLYVDLYFPQIAQGMDVRIGRYISLPDIEAQLAPNNYTYSHSLLYTFDCYTQTGINTTTRLNNRWTVQVGVSPGCDVAPWQESDRKLTLNACLQYNWNHNEDDFYFCANSINDGKYAYNNLQAYYFTWYHKFGESTWHSSTETWYQYERDTPNACYNSTYPNCSTDGDPYQPEVNANGAFCKDKTELTCYAPEFAIVNYLEKQFGPHNYLSIRNEFFNDIVGQRTGTKTKYTEHLLGWGHWVGTSILFRPELRFEHSYDRPAYDNYLKYSQLTLAGDIIFFF